MKKWLILIIVLISVISIAEDVNYGDLQTEEEKKQYLQQNYGIKILSNTDNVIVQGDTVVISNTIFNYRGASFFGGKVILNKGGQLIQAESVQASSPFLHKGVLMAGTFSLLGGQLIMEKGRMALGSESNPDFQLVAMKGTRISVDGGEGFTGFIDAANGPFKIGTNENNVAVSKKVKVVNGKIQAAEEIEAVAHTEGLFSDIDKKVSFGKGNLNKNKITAKDVCVNFECFSSTKDVTVTITKDVPTSLRLATGQFIDSEFTNEDEQIEDLNNVLGINVKGENVKYRSTSSQFLKGVLNGEATFEGLTSSFLLKEGSSYTNIQGGQLATNIGVSKDTIFVNGWNGMKCQDFSISCVSFKKYSSLHLQPKNNNQIKINRFTDMPTLSVDLIRDDSFVEFVEHKQNGMVGLVIDKNGLTAWPPTSLPQLDTRVVFQKKGSDKKIKTILVDPLSKDFTIIDEDSQHRDISGYMDAWAARNYYHLSFGGTIPVWKQHEYEDRLKTAFGEYILLSKQRKDFFIRVLHERPDLTNEELWFMHEPYSSLELDDFTTGEEFRRAFNLVNNEGVEEQEEYGTLNYVLTVGLKERPPQPLLQARLLEMYSNGELSKLSYTQLTKKLDVVDPTLFSTPEDVARYFDLIKKLPSDEKKVDDFTHKADVIGGLYKKYYDGKNKNNDYFSTMEQVAETGQIKPQGLKLPASLHSSVPHFIEFVGKSESVRPAMFQLDNLIEIWDKEPQLGIEVLSGTWTSNHPSLSSAIQEGSPQERQEAAKLLGQIGTSSKNEQLSKETKVNLRFIYKEARGSVYDVISQWNPEIEDGSAYAFMDSLPDNLKAEISRSFHTQGFSSNPRIQEDINKFKQENPFDQEAENKRFIAELKKKFGDGKITIITESEPLNLNEDTMK